MPEINNAFDCPCLSGNRYKTCCEPFHLGVDHAVTAEQLMRSRYTAYALGHQRSQLYATYLINTSLASQTDKPAIIQYMKNTRWISLVILDREKGQPADKTGIIEFCALSTQASTKANIQVFSDASQQHERSHFEKHNNRWVYTTGTRLKPIKFERNMSCWCGSGKKYKKCHAD